MKRIPHRFEEKWVAHPECETVIRAAWTNVVSLGSPMYNLFEKIKSCRVALVGWRKMVFGNSRAILEEKHRELEDLMGLKYVENAEAIKKVKEEINTRLYNDKLHWRQRSRSIWLQAGDKNTKFFLSKSKSTAEEKSYWWSS